MKVLVVLLALAGMASAARTCTRSFGDDQTFTYTDFQSDNAVSDGVGNYVSDMDCTIRVVGDGSTPFNSRAVLTLTQYSVEDRGQYDFLKVFSGEFTTLEVDVDQALKAMNEGDLSELKICSSSEDIRLEFTSDSGVEDFGFAGTITWETNPTGCQTDLNFEDDIEGGSSGGFDPTFLIIFLFVGIWIAASVYQAQGGISKAWDRMNRFQAGGGSMQRRTQTRHTHTTYNNDDMGFYDGGGDDDDRHHGTYGESDFGGNIDEDYSYMLDDMGGPSRAAKKYKSGSGMDYDDAADDAAAADGMDIFAVSSTPSRYNDEDEQYYDPDKTVFL